MAETRCDTQLSSDFVTHSCKFLSCNSEKNPNCEMETHNCNYLFNFCLVTETSCSTQFIVCYAVLTVIYNCKLLLFFSTVLGGGGAGFWEFSIARKNNCEKSKLLFIFFYSVAETSFQMLH